MIFSQGPVDFPNGIAPSGTHSRDNQVDEPSFCSGLLTDHVQNAFKIALAARDSVCLLTSLDVTFCVAAHIVPRYRPDVSSEHRRCADRCRCITSYKAIQMTCSIPRRVCLLPRPYVSNMMLASGHYIRRSAHHVCVWFGAKFFRGAGRHVLCALFQSKRSHLQTIQLNGYSSFSFQE